MESIDFFVENKTLFTIFHVISVIVGMGSALVSDFLFNFYSKDKLLSKTEIGSLELLSRIVWISLVFILLSGLGLFFSDPLTYMNSDKFISKMLVMMVLLFNGLFLSKCIAPHFTDRGLLKFKNKRTLRQIAFVCGSISLISWSVVCVLGLVKSIPVQVGQFIVYYALLVAFSALVSLVVEKRLFSGK